MIDEAQDTAHLRPPLVVIRSLADVRLAAATGLPFGMLSARGAGSSLGCLAWQALARAAREAAPGLAGPDILDCAASAGRALEALRLGQAMLVLDADVVGFADVRSRAATIRAVVLGARPGAFDPGLVVKPTAGLIRRLAEHLGADCNDTGPRVG